MNKRANIIAKPSVLLAFLGCTVSTLFAAPFEIPARLFNWDALSPCKEILVTESDGTRTKIIKCPKTKKFYNSTQFTEYDVAAKNIATVSFTGYIVTEFLVPDIVTYFVITQQLGKVSIGYPYDLKLGNSNFLSQDIMCNPVDGDYVNYISNGTNFSAWATYASKDNAIHWHEDKTFAVLDFAPMPDTNADFLYYRMQDTNDVVLLAGGLRGLHGDSVSIEKHGVDGVLKLVYDFELNRRINWSDNVIAKVKHWVREFPKLSIKDPRKFYVRLASGAKVFAMTLDDHRKLYSPITHASVSVSPDEIVGFEAIDVSAYPEQDCYSKNEVEALWQDFARDGTRSWWESAVAEATGEFYLSGYPFKSIWGKLCYWLLGGALAGLSLLFKPVRTRVCKFIKWSVRGLCIWLLARFSNRSKKSEQAAESRG